MIMGSFSELEEMHNMQSGPRTSTDVEMGDSAHSAAQQTSSGSVCQPELPCLGHDAKHTWTHRDILKAVLLGGGALALGFSSTVLWSNGRRRLAVETDESAPAKGMCRWTDKSGIGQKTRRDLALLEDEVRPLAEDAGNEEVAVQALGTVEDWIFEFLLSITDPIVSFDETLQAIKAGGDMTPLGDFMQHCQEQWCATEKHFNGYVFELVPLDDAELGKRGISSEEFYAYEVRYRKEGQLARSDLPEGGWKTWRRAKQGIEKDFGDDQEAISGRPDTFSETIAWKVRKQIEEAWKIDWKKSNNDKMNKKFTDLAWLKHLAVQTEDGCIDWAKTETRLEKTITKDRWAFYIIANALQKVPRGYSSQPQPLSDTVEIVKLDSLGKRLVAIEEGKTVILHNRDYFVIQAKNQGS